ncbi:hypothetical protein R1flu_003111 [Riccia fluitans]|uniref:Uncharacterized protein n=1 Tax=Riccia fluitans TaxID=41844 RepID=A0ABD1Y8F1_9MARC
MQGVPQLNGRFLETGTAGVSRLAAVRPFMNLNFGESVNNSAIGSRPQPVIQDFAESQVPNSQDPLPDGSVLLDAAADLTVEADVVQAGPRHRRQTASGKNASKPPAKEGVKSHFHWHDPAIVALIEGKKEEQDEDNGRSGPTGVLLREEAGKAHLGINGRIKMAWQNGYEGWEKTTSGRNGCLPNGTGPIGHQENETSMRDDGRKWRRRGDSPKDKIPKKC